MGSATQISMFAVNILSPFELWLWSKVPDTLQTFILRKSVTDMVEIAAVIPMWTQKVPCIATAIVVADRNLKQFSYSLLYLN